jgi:hypothetical protein
VNAPALPKTGPGRPAKPQAPRSADQARLADAVTAAETTRDAAEAAYSKKPTVASETALLAAEMAVAVSWGAYLRSQGNHTHALKYADIATKIAGRLAALRELAAVDQLDALLARAGREDALAKKGKKR